jgi:hypothetical protein
MGEVLGVRSAAGRPLPDGTLSVLFEAPRPVGRLSGFEYMLPDRLRVLPRP